MVLGDVRGVRPVPGVFVNYRTGDGDWAGALVKRELSAKFGPDEVFYASQSIRLGEDFSEKILGRLRQCDVLLAMIGPRWVAAVGRDGIRRLDKSDDWVRREIIEAFDHGLRVIPVLLDGINPLSEADLPDCLGQLARCQYLRMHHRNDDLDLTRLVDELVELVPPLTKTPARDKTVRRLSPATDGELRSTATSLREALSDPVGELAAVHNLVYATATHALNALGEAGYPTSARYLDDSELPAALEEQLTSYERDLAALLRLVAIGVCSGARQHDDLWITIAGRFLNRRRAEPRACVHEVLVAAEAYPALLVIYAVGVAGLAADREDLVHRLLCQTTVQSGERSVLRALALRNVVDPRHAAVLPKWDGTPPHQALSVHLRQILGSAFFNVLTDRQFELAFEDYEYVRSLLELHDGPFSSLGEFAVHMDKGHTLVHQRNAARLNADSLLLRSGAFSGDPDRVVVALRELQHSAQARYR